MSESDPLFDDSDSEMCLSDSDRDPDYNVNEDSSEDDDCEDTPMEESDKRLSSKSNRKQKAKHMTAQEILKSIQKGGSPKKECSICGKSLVNLNRHLKETHDIKESYRVVMPELIAKQHSMSKSKSKRRLKRCPLCKKIEVRLDHHLKTHKLSTEEYQRYMAQDNVYREKKADTDSKDINENNLPAVTCEVPKSKKEDHERFLTDYKKHCKSFRGGELSEKQAKQAVFQARQIVEKGVQDINNCTHDVYTLIDKQLESGEWKYGTCSTYLSSFKGYLRFLKLMSGIGIYQGIIVNQIQELEQEIDVWMKSLYKKGAAKRKEDAKNVDEDSVLNPDDFEIFFDGPRAKKAESMLKKKIQLANRKEHTQIRSYMIFRLMLSNANRTGVITNMTIDEFRKAKLRNNRRIARVAKHKLANVSGSAEMIIPDSIYGYMSHYIEHLRPSSKCNEVFVNWGGGQMDAGSVIHTLTAELGYLGIQKRLSCTKTRHMAASLITAVFPEADRADLTKLMIHSEKMQQSAYNDLLHSNKIIRMSNILEKVLTNQTITAADLEKAEFEYPGYDVKKIKLPSSTSSIVTHAIVHSVPEQSDQAEPTSLESEKEAMDLECQDEDLECQDEDLECQDEDLECQDEDLECQDEDLECQDEDFDDFLNGVEQGKRGIAVPQDEIEFIVKRCATLVSQKAGVKLHQVVDLLKQDNEMLLYSDKKWGKYTPSDRPFRLRDLLRKYQKERPKVKLARQNLPSNKAEL